MIWVSRVQGIAGILAIFLIFTAAYAAAQAKPQKLAAYGDWEVFRLGQAPAKVCFAAARPQASAPAGARRGEVYLMVAHKPAEKIRHEISVYFGYPLAEASTVEVQIGGSNFALFSSDRSAWAADAKTDKAISDAMALGLTLTAKGASARGTQTTDTYSLKGFTAVRNKLDSACPQ